MGHSLRGLKREQGDRVTGRCTFHYIEVTHPKGTTGCDLYIVLSLYWKHDSVTVNPPINDGIELGGMGLTTWSDIETKKYTFLPLLSS